MFKNSKLGSITLNNHDVIRRHYMIGKITLICAATLMYSFHRFTIVLRYQQRRKILQYAKPRHRHWQNSGLPETPLMDQNSRRSFESKVPTVSCSRMSVISKSWDGQYMRSCIVLQKQHTKGDKIRPFHWWFWYHKVENPHKWCHFCPRYTGQLYVQTEAVSFNYLDARFHSHVKWCTHPSSQNAFIS